MVAAYEKDVPRRIYRFCFQIYLIQPLLWSIRESNSRSSTLYHWAEPQVSTESRANTMCCKDNTNYLAWILNMVGRHWCKRDYQIQICHESDCNPLPRALDSWAFAPSSSVHQLETDWHKIYLSKEKISASVKKRNQHLCNELIAVKVTDGNGNNWIFVQFTKQRNSSSITYLINIFNNLAHRGEINFPTLRNKWSLTGSKVYTYPCLQMPVAWCIETLDCLVCFLGVHWRYPK